MAKFKAGDAVKLRDDVSINANVPYNTRFVVHEIDELRRCYLDCGYWIFEDALEAWPESTEELTDENFNPLMTFNKEGIKPSVEIDPQLLELVKVYAPVVYADTMKQVGNMMINITDQSIALATISIAKETLRLLREEKL